MDIIIIIVSLFKKPVSIQRSIELLFAILLRACEDRKLVVVHQADTDGLYSEKIYWNIY